MYPDLNIGPVTVHTFGLMFALAFLAAGAVVARRLEELGKPTDWAYEIIFCGLVGGAVGARLYYIIQNSAYHSNQLLSGSGLVWYGGAIGGALAVLGWAWYRGFFGLTLLDLCAPALALGYAIGRIGCQLSGDGDYGKRWDGPWAMAYPDGTLPTHHKVHPTPVYETLAMGIGALILWNLRERFRAGVLFAIYLVYAGTERFLVEFIRRNGHVFAGLTAPQLESLGMMVAGTVWLVVAARRGGLRKASAPERASRGPAGEPARQPTTP